jgi:predicted ArsR family transcriptional regulator
VNLERLNDAGLVARHRERRSRGRPRDSWSIDPAAQPGGDPPTAYADLARWLVRSLLAVHARARDVEAAGRELGRDLAAGHTEPASSEERFREVLGALGFQPEPTADGGDRLTYRLCNCPYRAVVPVRQTLVCGLHRGITRGMLDAIDPKTRLSGFTPKDPAVAGCLVEVRGPMVAQHRAGSTS